MKHASTHHSSWVGVQSVKYMVRGDEAYLTSAGQRALDNRDQLIQQLCALKPGFVRIMQEIGEV
jgi:hypothetical protein